MSPSKARANEVERTPTTNAIVLFRSPARLQHKRDRLDMERKHMNSDTVQRNESELTSYWSGTVGGGTNIQSMQARIHWYKS